MNEEVVITWIPRFDKKKMKPRKLTFNHPLLGPLNGAELESKAALAYDGANGAEPWFYCLEAFKHAVEELSLPENQWIRV